MRSSSAAQVSARPDQQISENLQRPGPARHRPAGPWPGAGLRPAVWYAGFAGYAVAVAVFCGVGQDRLWGLWASAGYAAAALAALWRRHGIPAALLISTAGALVAPLAWLVAHAPPTPDVRVVSRSAALLLRHGTPYLSAAQIGHFDGPIGYNPYLPVMAVFGIPRAIGVPGLAGDPRLWLGVASFLLLALAFWIAGRHDAIRCGLFAVASPVVAFPLVLGVTDPPVLALLCLALALLSRTSRLSRTSPTLPVWAAAVTLGLAGSMKATAWPALPVFAAMLAARDGARTAVRFSAAAVATTAVLVVASAPAVLRRPAELIQNTVLFPLGLTRVKTPAESPLLGHLLAMTAGRLVAVGLLTAVGLAVVCSLVVRPPIDAPAAAIRLALGLALMFLLSPATRLGYFAYPLGLYGWLVLTGSPARFRGLLDRGQRLLRDSPVRSLRALGHLGLGVVPKPVLKHGDAVGEELP